MYFKLNLKIKIINEIDNPFILISVIRGIGSGLAHEKANSVR